MGLQLGPLTHLQYLLQLSHPRTCGTNSTTEKQALKEATPHSVLAGKYESGNFSFFILYFKLQNMAEDWVSLEMQLEVLSHLLE